jgi:hypothetical protein
MEIKKKMDKVFEQISLRLKKEPTFIKYSFVQFFMVFNNNDISDYFSDDHYYIILFFVLKLKNIDQDYIIAIVFVVYSYYIDDWGCTSYDLYKAHDCSRDKFSSIVLKLTLMWSKDLFKFNEERILKWKNKLNGKLLKKKKHQV